MAKREQWIDPKNWASLKPFGIGEGRPNNYPEIWKAFRENRGRRVPLLTRPPAVTTGEPAPSPVTAG